MAGGHGNAAEISARLSVRFENVGAQTLTKIKWRAATPAGNYDFSDDGRFSPGLTIVHRLEQRGTQKLHTALPTLEVMGPGICSIVEAASDNGTTWKDPEAGAADIYVPPVPPDDAPTVPTSLGNPAHNPIGIISCTFTLFNANHFRRAFGHVRFRNLSAQTITEIKFRAYYGSAGMDFIKSGTFSPSILVDTGDMRRKDLPPNAFAEYVTLDSPRSCSTVSVRYADGTTWTNPDIGVTEPPFPEPRPYLNAAPSPTP